MGNARSGNPWLRGVRQAVVLAVLMGASFSGYLLVLRLRGPAGAGRETKIPWDDWFPFNPAWTWAYLVPYPIGPVLARNNWRWAAPAFLAAGVVWLATLITRQHHLIDVVTGALLALLVALPFGKKTS